MTEEEKQNRKSSKKEITGKVTDTKNSYAQIALMKSQRNKLAKEYKKNWNRPTDTILQRGDEFVNLKIF